MATTVLFFFLIPILIYGLDEKNAKISTIKFHFVTRTDIEGNLTYRNELHVLEPHSDAKWLDHDFLSPTFKETIKDHITEYIKEYGGKK